MRSIRVAEMNHYRTTAEAEATALGMVIAAAVTALALSVALWFVL